MNSNLECNSTAKNVSRAVVRIVSGIHLISSALIIFQFLWEFTELSPQDECCKEVRVEEFVRSIVTDENTPENYSHKEIMEMTIGYLVGEIFLHTAFLVAALCLLTATRKDSVRMVKGCMIFLLGLFLLSCLDLLIEIRHSHHSSTSSIICNGLFLLFQTIALFSVFAYFQVLLRSRKAEVDTQTPFRSNSESSDLTEVYF